MTPQELSRVAIWADNLSEAERQRAAPGVRTRQLVRGEHLMHLHDTVDAWHGVLDGVLRVGMVSDDGNVMGFSPVLGGGWFGEGAMIKNEPRRYDVVAVSDATIGVMRGETFRWLFANSVGFNRFLVGQLNERMGYFIATVVSDRTGTAARRLASTIAGMFNPVLFPKAPKRLPLSQEDLSIFAGMSRQMTNRVLRQLAAEGLVEVGSKGLTVLDPGGLRAFSLQAGNEQI